MPTVTDYINEIRRLRDGIQKIADEHRPTMQGSCTSCGAGTDWPCETYESCTNLLLYGPR